MRHLRPRLVRVALLVGVLLPLVLQGAALAQGGSGDPPGGPPAGGGQSPTELGARFFDHAIRYVARGRTGIPQIQDFYANLDARMDLDNQHHEGRMRVWFQVPTKYRQELQTNNAVTTKILDGELGWIVTPAGRVQNLALAADGPRIIQQLKDDRERLYDLAQFLTLQALKGPGVTFTFEGFKTGRGSYEGEWIKLVRRAPGRANITFWLAYVRDPRTGGVTATWPGVVRVDGEPDRGIPTEDYILKEWDSPQSPPNATFRYPRRIEAFALVRGPDGRPAQSRFLWAIVDDIRINAGISPDRWRPPQR